MKNCGAVVLLEHEDRYMYGWLMPERKVRVKDEPMDYFAHRFERDAVSV